MAGLIATHPPESLNLVLVDFKGGATFRGFERARHLAALITNLAGEAHLVARMTDALAGELYRRQELLRKAGSFANVAEYERARLAGRDLEPLPALVVIVDEFAELLSQHPDFVDLFAAIGRLGRSLRIHLLLASQRLDEGRLRGLESHLSYRICLKTFSANESRAVIGTPDAFHLCRSPGAAFLRVGAADPIAFQISYVSGRYVARQSSGAGERAVRIFTAAPMRSGVTSAERTADRAGPTVLETLLERLAGHGATAHPVWLPPLRNPPTLDALLGAGAVAGAIRAPIGMVDSPFEQRRDKLIVDLTGAAGNVAVVGAPQSGKSTALCTLIAALACIHSPREVQFYCLDFGGGALATLATLPHVGSVAGRAEPDLAGRIVAELVSLLRRRENVFRRLGVDSMVDYRRRRSATGDPVGAEPFGDVFLIVDGWSTLRNEFDDLADSITVLATAGLSYGIHFCLAASRWADVRPGLKDQIGSRIELRLGDPADSELNRYAAQHVPPDSPGRGITADGKHMQIALPRIDEKPDTVRLSDAIAAMEASIRQRFGTVSAPAVRLLPDLVTHDELIGTASQRQITIGLDEHDLRPVPLKFAEQPHLLILGESECGKTASLRLLCTEILRTATPQQAQVLIVDFRRTLLGVVESTHLASYVMSAAALSAQLPSVLDRLRARLPGSDLDQRELRTRSWWRGPEYYLIIDDYDLLETAGESTLLPLGELLPYAKDIGLHVIVARRAGGATRAMFDPVLGRLRDLGCMGLLMSARADEGLTLGSARPRPFPQGRGTLITRAGEQVVQVGWIPPCP